MSPYQPSRPRSCRRTSGASSSAGTSPREIAHTVATYRTLFETRATGPFDVDLWSERAWDDDPAARARCTPTRSPASPRAPGSTARQVASVNARTEILVAANPTGQTECSTVVSLPPGRPPVAVQTWDWYDAMSDGWFTWTIPMPDGRVVQTVTEFGMLAKIGVNDRGVGVMLNMLHHANDADAVASGEIGHPVHLLSRAILDDASSVDEAVAIASAPRTSASTSLTVLDDRGGAASVELFPGGPGVFEPDRRRAGPHQPLRLRRRPGRLPGQHHRGQHRDPPRPPGRGLRRATPPESTQDVARRDDPPRRRRPGSAGTRSPGTAEPLWTRTLATVSLDVADRGSTCAANGPCGHRLEPVEQPA